MIWCHVSEASFMARRTQEQMKTKVIGFRR